MSGYEQGAALLADGRMHADLAGMFEGAGITSGPAHDAVVNSFLSLNGEVHRRYRALISDRFTPRAVERLRPSIAGFAEAGTSRFDAGEVDVVADFAAPYVAAGTCTHLGMPIGHYADLEAAVAQVSSASKNLGRSADVLADGIEKLVSYARRVLRGEMVTASGGIISALAEHVAEDRMPEDVAAVLISAFLSAGNEPTVNQIGLSVRVLSEHPDLWDALGSGHAPLARTIEELLRYRSTNQAVNRKVSEPLTLDGVDFRQGEQVLIGIARCNHDTARFPHPDVVDPQANAGSNLSFGLGAHYCLGAALARVQLQEAVRSLTARLHCPKVVRAEEDEGGGLLSNRYLVLRIDPRS